MQYRPYYLFILFVFSTSALLGQASVKINPQEAGLSTERLERYDAFLESEVAEGNIAGAVSLVYRKGKIAHRAAYGSSNLAEKTPMTEDKIFHIMSMTKPIITVAFMMLYEEGHFRLSDKLSKYLPEFKSMEVALPPPRASR